MPYILDLQSLEASATHEAERNVFGSIPDSTMSMADACDIGDSGLSVMICH
ncbi:hypothetical protein HNR23_001549 [Nocardiopsis mwathae]|uniref:Uncharacterized protein n=1 Tax=Nocardiopsis mwathae TaxID=1472723 RepID=A0A7W9YG08_9ACTN|nr:SapB/AmfS family lanthipeptide [Nocardiopsis mwathae]MBB6171489.1 hypothetical protein [Nocardiopsis mwathae]